jgi:hypothetical protein
LPELPLMVLLRPLPVPLEFEVTVLVMSSK